MGLFTSGSYGSPEHQRSALGFMSQDDMGARANKFHIFITGGLLMMLDNLDVMVKASSVPSYTVEAIEYYAPGGRKLLTQGDATFTNEWTVTFYESTNHPIRSIILSWMNQYSNMTTGSAGTSNGSTGVVTQLTHNKEITTANYVIHNIWPKSVNEIGFAQDSNGQLVETEVTFAFDYWESLTTI